MRYCVQCRGGGAGRPTGQHPEAGPKENGRTIEIGKTTLERQCDPEFLTEMLEQSKNYDVILSMGCGAGVQLIAEKAGSMKVLPALNTISIGVVEEKGRWGERCQAAATASCP